MYGVTTGISAWALLRGQLADMQQRGWNVTVVANGDPKLHAASVREGVAALPLRMSREVSPKQDLVSLIAWFKVLRRERPDVLNLGTPKAALLGGIAGFLLRVPRRVYVVRGLRYEGGHGFNRWMLLVMERVTIACATDVVVVSRSVGSRLHEDGVTRRPVLLIGDGSSNGVAAAELAERAGRVDRSTVRAEIGVRPDEVLVGYVGRVTLDKGARTMRDAIVELRQSGISIRFVVVGEVESTDASTLLAELDEVVVTGWTDDPCHYLAAMDILVLPTRREGYPNVVLEANACGVPVIATRATGAVDSIQDGKTGCLIDVDDAHGLALALEKLGGDPEMRQAIADAARGAAMKYFRPERIWNGLNSIYHGQYIDDIRSFTR